MKIIASLILFLTIAFNLYLNFPETQILADPNDNIFQYSLVLRTNWIWQNYHCPFSFSCLPNLLDHNVTTWAEGYPLPFYYSHLPQIAIVASYNLIIQPLTTLFHYPFTLYQYYNWTKYLLYALFPLPVFFALKIIGFNPLISAMGAFFSSHLSTDGLYGIDPVSHLWRGYGLTSQLYAVFFLPLAIAFVFKTMEEKNFPNCFSFQALLFLTLTSAGHLGIGMLGILSILPFLFLDFKPQNIFLRLKKLFLLVFSLIFLLSYWIIPILLNNQYHMISFWDPIWKFDSYGWYEAIRQFFAGELFDWQRPPFISTLVVIGFFALLLNHRLFPFSFLFGFWFLMYFGRTTWGGLIDLIPGMKDFHLHRFIVGIHLAGIFLIPAGIEYFMQLLDKITKSFFVRISNIQYQSKKNNPGLRNLQIIQNITFYILSFTFISIIAYFTVQQTVEYTKLNNRWIGEANNAYRYDEKNFQDLVTYLNNLSPGRIYAGRPGNWGRDFRLGSTQMYMLLGVNGFDISQFLPETWSPLSENEQNFDERVAEDYDLLNIKYIVADKNHDFPSLAKLEKKFGPFELYQAPTSGWFDVVTSPMFVKTDKTNFINLVHLWHRGYPRRWKMHPLISVEKKPKIPAGMQKIIRMIDEVSYLEETVNQQNNAAVSQKNLKNEKEKPKNIFADFPFVFPEATVSGKIKNQSVKRQTYSATIDIPENCQNCLIMFKMSYHPNWQVKIDGQSADKFAVFPFYLATPVTPGTHTVEFTYYPNRLKVILLWLEILFLGTFLLLKRTNFLK